MTVEYTSKVTNKIVTVQILASSPKGGWEAVNTATGKTIYIKGPERLIKQVEAPKDKDQTIEPSVQKKTPAQKPAQAKSAKGKLSLLDAAVEILKKQSPLTCRQMIERMAEAELWKSEAATPANTLHAAISKEIRVKGQDARFEKIDRGQFSFRAE